MLVWLPIYSSEEDWRANLRVSVPQLRSEVREDPKLRNGDSHLQELWQSGSGQAALGLCYSGEFNLRGRIGKQPLRYLRRSGTGALRRLVPFQPFRATSRAALCQHLRRRPARRTPPLRRNSSYSLGASSWSGTSQQARPPVLPSSPLQDTQGRRAPAYAP